MHDTRGWRPNFVPDIFHWNDLAVGKQVKGRCRMRRARRCLSAMMVQSGSASRADTKETGREQTARSWSRSLWMEQAAADAWAVSGINH